MRDQFEHIGRVHIADPHSVLYMPSQCHDQSTHADVAQTGTHKHRNALQWIQLMLATFRRSRKGWAPYWQCNEASVKAYEHNTATDCCRRRCHGDCTEMQTL